MNRPSRQSVPQAGKWTKAFPFYESLSPRGKALLWSTAAPKVYAANTVLLEEGQPCGRALMVTRGAIRVHKTSASGRDITLYLVRPGEMCVLGISCLLRDTRYPARASVRTDTEAIGIPAPAFRLLFREEESVQQFVLEMFSSRLSSVMRLVEEVAFRRMDERLAVFLQKEATRATGPYHKVDMSHEQIASHLGTVREVISRLLSQFEDDGLVMLDRRRIRIPDPTKLASLVPSEDG